MRVGFRAVFFRWDLYSIRGSSQNMTRVSMVSRATTLPQGDTVSQPENDKKGKLKVSLSC